MVNRLLLLAGVALASPALAQVSNTVGTVPLPPSQAAPAPTPTPTPTATVVTPPPIVTTISPVPTPSATPTARAPSVARRRAAVPEPRVTPAAVPTPTPTPSASPSEPEGIPPIVAPAPTPTATEAPVSASPERAGLPIWAIPAGLIALVVLGGAIMAWRRRRAQQEFDSGYFREAADEPATPPPAAIPAPLPLARETPPPPLAETVAPTPSPRFLEPTAPLAPRAMLAVAVTPRRAGVNLITATADVEVTVTNEGDVPARDVRIGVQLTSAQPGQDDALARLFAEPIARPVTAPFALAPGETRTVRALATLAREAIVVLTAADRPMFVPVVAVNVAFDNGSGQPGQTAAAFAVGVEREGSDKLAPFWLDGPSRMHERLGARPHALSLRS